MGARDIGVTNMNMFGLGDVIFQRWSSVPWNDDVDRGRPWSGQVRRTVTNVNISITSVRLFIEPFFMPLPYNSKGT